jgi:hypothetical protein
MADPETCFVIGAWPKRGKDNPRNARFYQQIEKMGVSVIDLKTKPWMVFRCSHFHVHWPEKAFFGYLPIKSSLFIVMTLACKIAGVAIIFTVHNDYREEIKYRWQKDLFIFWLSQVDFFHHTNSRTEGLFSESLANAKHFKIPLGLYKRSPKETGEQDTCERILIFGRLTRKKDIIGMLSEICQVSTSIAISVVGQPEDIAYANELTTHIKTLPNDIVLNLGFVQEEEVDGLLLNHDAIALNYFRGNHSGVATLAASYNLPIVVNFDRWQPPDMDFYGVLPTNISMLPRLRRYKPKSFLIEDAAIRFLEVIKNEQY